MSHSSSDNTIKNLARIAGEEGILAERRILELYELVEAALSLSADYYADGLGPYEILSILKDKELPGAELHGGTPPEVKEPLDRYFSSLGVLDRAVIADLLSRGAAARGLPFAEVDLLHSAEGEDTFIYSRNAFSDEAYDVLSQDFADPRVRYGSSFSDCVRAVTSGECRFCLLPLEEKGGSRLPTVAELIYRSDLKVNAVTPVFGYDGAADLKYALLSRDFIIPASGAGDDRYLEVRISAEGDAACELFAVIRYLGHTLFRADTQSFDTEGERDTYLSLVIRDGGEGFAALLIYLALFTEDYTPVGLYKNLE